MGQDCGVGRFAGELPLGEERRINARLVIAGSTNPKVSDDDHVPAPIEQFFGSNDGTQGLCYATGLGRCNGIFKVVFAVRCGGGFNNALNGSAIRQYSGPAWGRT